MTCHEIYPFTAIVGQEMMKLALILNAINPKIGGVLIQGMKGTAKSTAVRALADILPKIEIIQECRFNCNPHEEQEMCVKCQEHYDDHHIGEEDIMEKKMSVITLPINATEDRVVGTIDIKKALVEGIKALEPGILAEANRNILYIDEVNLLADNVADVLLDSAAMGVNIIEREGISFHHPANFILVGTMNPEEGNLRPQLLDRFGLSVNVERIQDIEARVEIVKRVERFQINPKQFCRDYEEEQDQLRERITSAQYLLNEVSLTEEQLKKIAALCIEFQTDGHRADITIARTAKTIAAFNERREVNEEDIKIAARLALSHRMRRLPFEDQILDEEKIDEMIQENYDQEPVEEQDIDQDILSEEVLNMREEVFKVGKDTNADKIIEDKRIREKMNTSGKRILHPTSSSRGKYVGGEKPRDFNFTISHDIALNETLNKAALEKENRDALKNGDTLTILEDHIHIKRRMGKSSYLIIFCVDASGSMGVKNRMEAVKGAIFSILQTNYIHRDKVALVVFRKDKAEVVLPPTRSTDLAYKLLKEIPTGGTTPLVEGLSKAIELAMEEKRKNTGYIPLIVLLSDARGNVYYKDAMEDLINTGTCIAKNELEMIIIDTENSDVSLGINKKLSEASNAVYYHIDNLNEQELNNILKKQGLIENS
ncbi:MAG: VWA domain-containing protein [Candidatus Lokiarchaeota archaeon]|nr:VWA domain-containing protein [Candidatus Lokiarchaeota archaeon]